MGDQGPSATIGWRRWLAMRRWTPVHQFLLVLFLLYLGKEALNVVLFPPFTGHDEVAHYSYVRTVAEDHRLPRLLDVDAWRAGSRSADPSSGAWLHDDLYPYCQYVLDWSNVCYPDEAGWLDNPPHAATYPSGLGIAEYQPAGYQYLANHPPLYYLVMTPVYWASDGASLATQQYVLRSASVFFGVLTVLFAYVLATLLFPGETFLALTVPAFVAFQPQISYEAAMVNNDILTIALYSLVLYLLVRGLRDRFPWRLCVVTGVAFGLALLAKGTAVTAAPLIALAVVLGVGWRGVRGWVVKGAAIAGLAGLVSSPWYIFLYRTYGNLDGFEQISKLQWWNYYRQDPPSILDQLVDLDFAVMRWRETWGEFGWRLIRLNDSLLWAIGIPCLLAVAGLVWYLAVVLLRRRETTDPVLRPHQWQRHGVLLMLVTAVVAYLAVLEFGTRFSLTQARYYFPAINAVALLLMLGLRTLIPAGGRHFGQAGIVAALLVMNVLIYTQYVIPYWHLDAFDVRQLYGGR